MIHLLPLKKSKLRRTGSAGLIREFNEGFEFSRLKNDVHQQRLLKEFLKTNKRVIETHVDLGSEPLFDCPPVIYSPPHDPYANLVSTRPEDRYPFLRQVVRHVLT